MWEQISYSDFLFYIRHLEVILDDRSKLLEPEGTIYFGSEGLEEYRMKWDSRGSHTTARWVE
jgi:predicted TPR repeat methyltransferase